MEKFNIIHESANALVERWRRETFIFHLPYKEATITLKDVTLIIELMINEIAVIEPSAIDTEQYCGMLLGVVSSRENLKESDGELLQCMWLKHLIRLIPHCMSLN
ncbi:hypothetical protein PVK06_031537 [Gossypium arboreum]|uniref:Aminotransferase-like plant mobile domain-containing protein n=1 Tax=Gossypium arboreum TaxID=29729 RepID=A0ABR0NUJ9_GOSAR|nr:hypothetical protein PVK06_031537 [Gossypium arboreum]